MAAIPIEMLKANLKTNSLINLSSNIEVPLGTTLYLPPDKEINPGNYKFISAGGKILFDSYLSAGRRQVFEGFKEGEVQGTFGRSVYPEWWGLIPEKHDIAINCAIRSGLPRDYGNTISLNAGKYFISASIDLREGQCQLIGQGAGATQVIASKNYNPVWEESNYWTGRTVLNSHSALVWIGAKNPGGGQSFKTNIKGITFNGYNAVRKWPDKRIAIIASTSWVEENHIIEDVVMTDFSGFGIGFHHPKSICTVNGLSIRNFWIMNSVKRDSVPIFIPPHAASCSITNGTIDCRLNKENSAAAVPAPNFIQDWPQFGIICCGAATKIECLHLEGMGIGIYVMGTDVPSSFSIDCIDGWKMMDSNMVYHNDPARIPGPPPSLKAQTVIDTTGNQDFYFKYGCIVAIGKQKGLNGAASNYNSLGKLGIIRSLGECKYLVRDWTYRKEKTTIGSANQYPNSESAATAGYERNDPYTVPLGTYPNLTRTWYDGTAPETFKDKVYFDGLN